MRLLTLENQPGHDHLKRQFSRADVKSLLE
jgi:hypothetical protein